MTTATQTATGAEASNTQVPNKNQLVGVRARLQKNLNAKKVKPGDVILAHPEVKIHVVDGLDLDRDSTLVGHVDKVQPSVDGNDSAIGVTFDKLQLKGGLEVAIKATILWIGQPPDYLNPTVHSAAADRTTPGVGVGAGFTGTPPPQGYQGSEIAGLPSENKQSVGTQKTGLAEGISIQMDAIAGVNFFSDMGRPDSGWFRSKKANVSIPAGTVLAFAIVALPDIGTHP
ncbi:MAG TPA: hypothetical protein VIX42_12475 [Edaphobacter sp.]